MSLWHFENGFCLGVNPITYLVSDFTYLVPFKDGWFCWFSNRRQACQGFVCQVCLVGHFAGFEAFWFDRSHQASFIWSNRLLKINWGCGSLWAIEHVCLDMRVDKVIHAGALHAPHATKYTEEQYYEVNVQGTINLLDCGKPLLFTSTTSHTITANVTGRCCI